MKIAFNRVAHKDIKKHAICDPFWSLGFTSLMIGSILNTTALMFGNQILLASASSLTVIFNSFLSVFILKERLMKIDILGIIIAAIGSILFLLSAKNHEK